MPREQAPITEPAGVEPVPYSWVTCFCKVVVHKVFLHMIDRSPTYRGTSLIRNSADLGPYRKAMPS